MARKPVGWRRETARHSLAARGIKSGSKKTTTKKSNTRVEVLKADIKDIRIELREGHMSPEETAYTMKLLEQKTKLLEAMTTAKKSNTREKVIGSWSKVPEDKLVGDEEYRIYGTSRKIHITDPLGVSHLRITKVDTYGGDWVLTKWNGKEFRGSEFHKTREGARKSAFALMKRKPEGEGKY